MSKLYEQFCERMQKIANVNTSIAVLHWDQEIHMPEKAAQQRASQIATLSGIGHELFVSEDTADLLENLKKLNGSLSTEQARNVEEVSKDYEKSKKYSTDFVMKSAAITSEGYQNWLKARQQNDFSIFAPSLKKIVDLKREEAALIGYTEHPYDALLDQFEPGATTAQITALFADVRAQLVAFVKKISEKPPVESKWLNLYYNKDKQWNYSLTLLEKMGYDFKAGRQDISEHPFTTTLGNSLDVRVTTRIDEHDPTDMIFGSIHEGGHALYEQGLSPQNYGLPAGNATSLGIHESQSRLWENMIGRSLAYWKYHYPTLQAQFPENLQNVSLTDFYKSINKVEASLKRTTADELTYHFHILIRFEVEKALIEGSLEVENVQEYWNSKYKAYLGVSAESAYDGVLQDIHWSGGGIGYFPTYSLGSFYAAQFFAQAQKDVPNLVQHIENGNTQPLLEWLRTNVHQYGRLYTAEEICRKATGEPLNFKYFMDYVTQKYGEIYNL